MAMIMANNVDNLTEGESRLEGRPDELLKREDFEELFLGAGTSTPASPEEDDDKR
jgi:hypothetical protein